MNRRLGLLVGLGLLLSSCRMTLDLNVSVDADGSGLVEVVLGFDADAVSRAGGDISSVLDLSSFLDSGWKVEGPSADPDGTTRVRISHPFVDPAEAADLFEQIAPAGGPFQDFRIGRGSSLLEESTTFRGRVDLGGDTAIDPGLLGEDVAATVSEVEAQLGESLSRLLQVRVSVRLPGEVSSNATTKADNGAVWPIRFGEGAVELEATGTERRVGPLVGLGVAALTVVALALFLLFRLARRATARPAGS